MLTFSLLVVEPLVVVDWLELELELAIEIAVTVRVPVGESVAGLAVRHPESKKP